MANPDESLLTGRNLMCTVKIEGIDGAKLTVASCYAILFNYWAPRVWDDVKTMRPFADGTGCAFDIRSAWIDGFLDNYEYLKNAGRRMNFTVSRAKSLPECGEDEERPEKEDADADNE